MGQVECVCPPPSLYHIVAQTHISSHMTAHGYYGSFRNIFFFHSCWFVLFSVHVKQPEDGIMDIREHRQKDTTQNINMNTRKEERII